MMTLPTKRTIAEHNKMIVDASRLVEKVKALDDATRAEFIDQLRGEVCVYCGDKSLPCYCMRDD